MRALFFVASLVSLTCVRCSPSRQDDAPAALAERVRRTFASVEEKSSYSEKLTPEIWAEHRKNVSFLAEKIPPEYPEPYLPYGALENRELDFSLARRPFLNADVVALGEKLFFESQLSFSAKHQSFGGASCGQCHLPDAFFTDGRATSPGVDGAHTTRNSPTILNAAYNATLTWGNAVFPVLEMQARIPLFGDDPVEMGLRGKEKEVLAHLLSRDADYVARIERTFDLRYPQDLENGRIDYNLVTAALAAYERSLINFDTRFDRFLQGRLSPEEELTPRESMGLELFFGFRPLASGERLACAQCHAGLLFTNSYHYVRAGTYYNRKSFHNTGMYNLDGRGAYPAKNTGFASEAELAEHPAWMGQFRVPPLRFVAKTAPYGHDGSLPTLEAVIRHYAAGGQASLGEKGQNPFVDPLVRAGFHIEKEEVDALVGFLETLH